MPNRFAVHKLKGGKTMPICLRCTNPIHKKRYDLGIRLCLTCGDRESKRITRTIVPSHKGAYQPVGDLKYLKMLNKYANG